MRIKKEKNMSILAVNNNYKVTPMVNNSKINSKLSENPTEQSSEGTKLPSLNFCSAYASNIKMFSFDKIAEKSDYSLLKDNLYLDFDYSKNEAEKVKQWKEGMVTISESPYHTETVDIYNKNTVLRDGTILREQISDNSRIFDRNDISIKTANDAGKYQTIWYKNPNDNSFLYFKKIDDKPVESLLQDSENPKFWHYSNKDRNVDVVLNTGKLNKMGYSDDAIFKKVTGYDDNASYGLSLRAYYATMLSKGMKV